MRFSWLAALVIALVTSVGARVEAQPRLRLTGFDGELKNGGFEDGFSSWRLLYKWNILDDRWRYFRPSVSFPEPAIIDSTWDEFRRQAIIDPAFQVTPFCGSHTALINGIAGNHHHTKLKQSFRVRREDLTSSLRIKWGAFLVDGHHPAENQASVSIKITGGGTTAFSYTANASESAANGWVQAGTVDTLPIYYRAEERHIPLGVFAANDKVHVTVQANDCDGGPHAACLLLDCVEVESCANVVGSIDVYIPDIFSPNGDSENDTWDVFGTRNATVVQMDVYDRWEVKVFHKAVADPNGLPDSILGWDGTYDGDPMPTAVYAYKVSVWNCSTSDTYSGNLTLVR